MTANPVHTYQLKITLRDTSPPIWRRVTLPADTSLSRLHDIIQTCFGWHDSHLHAFTEPGSGRQFVDFDSPRTAIPAATSTRSPHPWRRYCPTTVDGLLVG